MEFEQKGWTVSDRTSFIEVLPQGDSREHYLGDECWCAPVVEAIPQGIPDVMIVHNAADKRELAEGVAVV